MTPGGGHDTIARLRWRISGARRRTSNDFPTAQVDAQFLPLAFQSAHVHLGKRASSLIAIVAYLRAERPDFAAGHELEDWLAAEAEVNARLSHVRKLVGFAAR